MPYRRAVQFVEGLEPRRLLASIPIPDHVVVVVEENHAYQEIVGNPAAPYINSLATQGALFTQSFAVAHPSQPNYLALFSGSTRGVTDDNGPLQFKGPDLASLLQAVGRTFGGYSEDLPTTGSTVLQWGAYARKHNPWSDFSDVPVSENRPFSAFPTNFSSLPTVSFVVPNLNNDMHDGSIAQADQWLGAHLSAYATWARTHNSLLIVTWDEDDLSQSNRIPTIFLGQSIKPGHYAEYITHYSVLRTIEDMYHLSPLGASASAASIQDVWLTNSLQAHPVSISSREGTRFTSVAAGLTDTDNNSNASLYKTTINWGDGSALTPGTIAWSSLAHQWQISGTHRYRYAGTYRLSMALTDSDGSTATILSTAVISDAPISAAGRSIVVSSTVLASNPQALATLTDANPFAEAPTFAVSINWGDGSSSAGKVQWDWNLWVFDVMGSHQYRIKNRYSVTVTITDLIGGAKAIAQSTLTLT